MKRIIIVLLTLFLLNTNLHAQAALRTKSFNLDKNLAIQGFDPVAYFTTGIATKGNKDFVAVADGITYLFATASNKELFLKDFKKYEPQYGGWCAYAMGYSGEKVEIDPGTFKILNGKLYLFYHSWANNTLNKWNKDEVNLKNKADKNWSSIYH
jgi:YHS domain-containing protein